VFETAARLVIFDPGRPPFQMRTTFEAELYVSQPMMNAFVPTPLRFQLIV